MIRPWLIALAILALASNAAAQNVLNVPQGASLTAGGSAGQVQYYGTGGALAGFTMGGDCTLVASTGAITCTTLNGQTVTQILTTPPPIGSVTPNTGVFSTLTDSGITGSTQCIHVNSAGLLSGVGADCGSPLLPGGTSGAIQYNSGSSSFSGSTATVTSAGALTGLGYDFLGTTSTCTASTNGFHVTTSNQIHNCINGSDVGYFSSTGLNSTAVGASAASTGSFTTLTASSVSTGTIINSTSGHRLFNSGAPTIASGFCSSPTISAQNGTGAFLISVGTSCSGNTTGTLNMSTATTGWACHGTDFTTHGSYSIDMFSISTTQVTVNVYSQTTGLATPITSSDKIEALCLAY